ncbi:MAG: primosomal protein N', partial [Planctomycetes bacterium]|nr:primosomal protein N' [Planctomycetota bacterium]
MFAEVLVNLPVDRTFTYAVPPGMRVARGSRVVVPFRGRPLGGFVLRLTEEAPPFAVKEVSNGGEVLIDDGFFDLARWIADRYACGWGEALEAAVPTGVKKRRAARTVTVARLAGPREPATARSPNQRRILELLGQAGPLTVADMARRLGSRPSLAPLVKKGWVVTQQVPGEIDALADVLHEAPKEITLTPEQEAALATIAAHPTGVTLIHGVTGSGKTEVYLRAIERVVAAGKQAIVLVPEIALTPQTVSRFRARFPRIAVLHSVLTEADRAAQWRTTRAGGADVIIGARSAVFAPTRALGLVVIDEEHEAAYKQDNAPRYHAREVAIERARREGAGVVLGSATPSIESLFLARRGDFRLATLSRRIEGRPMPEIEVVDMAAERAELKRFPILSRRLVRLMTETTSRGEQTILFLNRRGYVTQIVCTRCKWVFRCRRCDVAMTHHREQDRCLCHYCFDAKPVPEVCADCRAGGLLRLGIGTERIEDEVKTLFPGRTVARMDSDSMKTRRDYRESLGGL